MNNDIAKTASITNPAHGDVICGGRSMGSAYDAESAIRACKNEGMKVTSATNVKFCSKAEIPLNVPAYSISDNVWHVGGHE